MRNKFEEFGEIKTFFDLISNRGMIFVTFVSGCLPFLKDFCSKDDDQFDLRAAERARDRLQGTEISGRPVRLHLQRPLNLV